MVFRLVLDYYLVSLGYGGPNQGISIDSTLATLAGRVEGNLKQASTHSSTKNGPSTLLTTDDDTVVVMVFAAASGSAAESSSRHKRLSTRKSLGQEGTTSIIVVVVVALSFVVAQ